MRWKSSMSILHSMNIHRRSFDENRWRKISSVASHWGAWLRTHHWGIEREEKKPSTWQESNPRPQEFCSTGMCSTTVLQPLPWNRLTFEMSAKNDVITDSRITRSSSSMGCGVMISGSPLTCPEPDPEPAASNSMKLSAISSSSSSSSGLFKIVTFRG